MSNPTRVTLGQRVEAFRIGYSKQWNHMRNPTDPQQQMLIEMRKTRLAAQTCATVLTVWFIFTLLWGITSFNS